MKSKLLAWGVLGASIALLAACGGGGGGGGGDQAPATPVPSGVLPPEASQSAAALKRVLDQMVAAPSEDGEPLDLTGFTPPAADDTEPELLS